MTYTTIKFAVFLITALPINFIYWIAINITHIFFFFWKEKKINTESNYKTILKDILGREPLIAEIKNLAFQNRVHYGKFSAEFLYLPKLAKKDIFPDITNKDSIDLALKRGRGLIIGTLHFSNWDIAGIVISKYCKNVWAVADDLGGDFSRFVQETRGKYGINIILPNKNLKDVYRCLENNGVLNVLIDRPVSAEDKNGTVIDFFGKKARVTSFAARLALKTGADVAVGWTVRENGKFTAFCSDIIKYNATGNTSEDIRNLTQLMFKEAEKAVRKNPEQWYMFRKFFIDQETK